MAKKNIKSGDVIIINGQKHKVLKSKSGLIIDTGRLLSSFCISDIKTPIAGKKLKEIMNV